MQTSRSVCTKRFLSTPSARRATSKAKYGRILCVISIHALREEGDARSSPKQPRSKISIHALREEGDWLLHIPHIAVSAISIHALREEGDHRWRRCSWQWRISIHALREEGDKMRQRLDDCSQNFYPRPPRGGRPPCRGSDIPAAEFLSTPSARRATTARRAPWDGYFISIHALREEGDGRRSNKTAEV